MVRPSGTGCRRRLLVAIPAAGPFTSWAVAGVRAPKTAPPAATLRTCATSGPQTHVREWGGGAEGAGRRGWWMETEAAGVSRMRVVAVVCCHVLDAQRALRTPPVVGTLTRTSWTSKTFRRAAERGGKGRDLCRACSCSLLCGLGAVPARRTMHGRAASCRVVPCPIVTTRLSLLRVGGLCMAPGVGA
jgi:hypothetical protein